MKDIPKVAASYLLGGTRFTLEHPLVAIDTIVSLYQNVHYMVIW